MIRILAEARRPRSAAIGIRWLFLAVSNSIDAKKRTLFANARRAAESSGRKIPV
ncbi:MAG TPA: hypothetical protein VEH26_04990 [Chthoniobacterales bacterium]|nr:hypothetical protein [Chthoniobacterales bacterium]